MRGPLLLARTVTTLSVLAILTGCAQTLRLKVVDATDNRPLEGVAMTWIKVQPGLLKGIHSERMDLQLPPSANGVPIRDVGKQENHTFILMKPGYQKATVVYHAGKGFIDSPDFVKPGDSIKRISIHLTNPIVVRMYRDEVK